MCPCILTCPPDCHSSLSLFLLFSLQEGSSSSLATLELYVNELFSGNANKEQIQKIHQALDNFSRQKGAWKDALYFLSQTTNPQTAMYALTVLEVTSVFISFFYCSLYPLFLSTFFQLSHKGFYNQRLEWVVE